MLRYFSFLCVIACICGCSTQIWAKPAKSKLRKLSRREKAHLRKIIQACKIAYKELGDQSTASEKKKRSRQIRHCQKRIHRYVRRKRAESALHFLLTSRVYGWVIDPRPSDYTPSYQKQIVIALKKRLSAIPLKKLSADSLVFLWLLTENEPVHRTISQQLCLRKSTAFSAIGTFIKMRAYVTTHNIQKLLTAACLDKQRMIKLMFLYWESNCDSRNLQDLEDEADSKTHVFFNKQSKWLMKQVKSKKHIRLLHRLLKTSTRHVSQAFNAMVVISKKSPAHTERWIVPLLDSKSTLHRHMAAITIARTGQANVKIACKTRPKHCSIVTFWHCDISSRIPSTHKKCSDYRKYLSYTKKATKEGANLVSIGDFNHDGRLDWTMEQSSVASRSSSEETYIGSANGCQITISTLRSRSRSTGEFLGKSSTSYEVRYKTGKSIEFSSKRNMIKHLKKIKCSSLYRAAVKLP